MDNYLEAKNSRKQGDIGLGAAIGWLAEQGYKGYTVSIPLTDSQDYDLVVEIEGKLKKVQVKTSTRVISSGAYEVRLLTKGGNQSWSGVVKHFDPAKVDYLFIMTGNGEKYFIPTSTVSSINSISVGKKYTEYKI